MNVCESLVQTARRFPEKIAMVYDDRRFTYAEVDRLSLVASHRLREAGVTTGDRVAIMLPNTPAFVVWYYAALRLGAIAVSISTRLAASEIDFLLRDCEALAMVTLDDFSAAGLHSDLHSDAFTHLATSPLCDELPSSSEANEQHLWENADPHAPAVILYTSGTTGFAKGAVLSHANVRSNVHCFNHLCRMSCDDRVLLAVPLFHCFGQNAILNSVLNVGGTIVLQKKFDLNESKKLIKQHQVTQLYGVPMMFQLMHERCEPSDLASINYYFSAAATLPIQVERDWAQKFGLPIYQGYGLTETSPFASYNHRDQWEPGSIGTAIDNVEMKIVDSETGKELPMGELGEIAIRGPNVMIGYWNRPDDTATAIRDGWFHSGDIGRMDQRGYFYIVDRVKDMITIGGLKVFPAEVERVLLDHPKVAQTAVIGVEDAVFGEQVVAFVVAADSAGTERNTEGSDSDNALPSLLAHANQHLGNYKRPKRIFRIDALPRNPSGKVLKTELRKLAARLLDDADSAAPDAIALDAIALDAIPPDGMPPDAMPQPATSLQAQPLGMAASPLQPPTLQLALERSFDNQHLQIATNYVQALVARMLELEQPPSADAQFLEIGLDSLQLVAIANQAQVEAGPSREISPTLVFDHPRVCDLAQFLVKALTVNAANPTSASLTPLSAPPASASPTADVSHHQLRAEIESMGEDEAERNLMLELQKDSS